MRRFFNFSVIILAIILIAMALLDLVYTNIYMQNANRNKVSFVYNSPAKNYDVVILGSSRANNHFVTPMFEKSGLHTFNYGISGGHLFEASLLLKLMIEKNYEIKNLIIEADLNLANERRSDAVAAKFLPYIHSSAIIKDHFIKESDFYQLYYIPFYRYLLFDNSIGFREAFKNVIKEPTNTLENGGFHPLGNKKGNIKNDIRALAPIHNKYYEEIKEICAANHINLIAVMTPMCTNVKGLDYFEKVNKIYPEIHNYENAVEGDQYFSSCGHLNDKGARIFTATIIKELFN